MSKDPFDPEEKWLSRDEFSVRREIIPTPPQEKAKRGSNPMPKFLPKEFQDAHPWALQWGGPEIEQGRFYAHAEFNKSAQTRVEYAGLRLTETARENGVRIRATVAVTRYPERNLLERATYKFEAVVQVGKDYRIEPLGEITITQDLSQKQRTAMVEGTRISHPGADVLEYRHRGEIVKIDTKKLVKISSGDVFASLQRRLGGFILGLEKESKESKTPRGKQIQKAEKAAIVEADREARASTAAPPIRGQDLTNNKSTENRGAADGRPAVTDRATTKTSTVTSSPLKETVQDKLNSASRKIPTADDVKALESALSKGNTEVASAGGNQVRVTLKKAGVKTAATAGKFAVGASTASNMYNLTQGLLKEVGVDMPVLDPLEHVKAHITKKVGAGVERGIRWINANYPPVQQFLQGEAKARDDYRMAKDQLNTSGRVWEAVLKSGTKYGVKTWQISHDQVLKFLSIVEIYDRKIDERNSRLAAEINELDPIWNEIDTYVSALYKIANELEDKVELACILPAGYHFGLQLFVWSQFVRERAQQVGSLTNAISAKQLDYRNAMDKGFKLKEESNALSEKWGAVVEAAEQAAGI